MSPTTMHFGPEWMRTKQNPPSKIQNPPSPSSMPHDLFEKHDDPNPFRYSKDEMLRIYKEGNLKSGLAQEVQRWDGVVREVPSEPVGLREMGEAEMKIFSGSLNSDLRRRQQSGEYLSSISTNTDRTRMNYPNSSANSPLRERFGALRRRDSTADSPTGISPLPRKQSFSGSQNPVVVARDVGLPSPRSRVGLTSNFDGVLNTGGESWGARRRASEVSLKGSVSMSRETSSENHSEPKANEIREELEEEQSGADGTIGVPFGRRLDGQSRTQADSHETGSSEHNIDLQSNHSNQPAFTQTTNGLPLELQDLASVEWSYKDPTGQIQGPFRADLMQKWYDEGYFSPDLPMKRTYLDSQWMTVEELSRRASSDKIFFSPPLPVVPPGLVRRGDFTSQPYSLSTEHNIHPSINQPSPIRTLRSSTLDNYIASGSNSSDGGARYSNGSPDSSAPGGMFNNSAYFANIINTPDVATPFPARRATYGDAFDRTLVQSPGSSSVAASRTTSVGEYTFNGIYNPALHPEAYIPSRVVEPAPLNAYNHSPVIEQGLNYHNVHDGAFFDRGSAPLSQDFGSANQLRARHDNTSPFGQYNVLGSSVDNAAPAESHFSQPMSPFLTHPNVQLPVSAIGRLNQSAAAFHSRDLQTSLTKNANQAPVNQSPWQEISVPNPSSSTRTDTLHHNGSNTTLPLTASQASPWDNKLDTSQGLSHSREPSPWSYTVPVADNLDLEHDRLTFSNVVQHNQRYQVPEAPEPHSSDQQAGHASIVPTSIEPSNEPRPSRSKVHVQPDQDHKITALAVATPPDTSEKVDAPLQSLPPKTAWATDEDSKKSAVTISLREIQEAEAKKSEARKASERGMKATSSESRDDVQPFTTSWGLPSSQVGARPPAPSKEATTQLSPSTSTPSAPVWTNAVKTAATKKSMKEIQEEEERRKKLNTAKEASTSTAVRKASAEPAHKAPTVQASAWTVVGSSGKTPTPAAISGKSPLVTAGTVVKTSSASRVPVSKPPIHPAPVKSPTAPPPKVTEDFPPAPSHDFLRWLTESLKGLNSSVNVEEIMSMLLSFPLDPDLSTIELISDLIYTNSTTLDGRRFATEFVGKRKNDATSRVKSLGAPEKNPAKPASIADVVKTAPKATQPEWAFKVVNKKKKGGRT
ncbi:hypothetical protein M378DRAFT_155483 [Amanita muscaria Koide BX008]|uniref:GYF domain-containing protein n=1 Tax=Amanita muscaria (strain Koide BX008) TaxID=946122 RepID=A0A0C2X885_AMAMK|nr:hypothetical protein M378DRAFT_155483 [Amanita muscaria Koide BX008]